MAMHHSFKLSYEHNHKDLMIMLVCMIIMNDAMPLFYKSRLGGECDLCCFLYGQSQPCCSLLEALLLIQQTCTLSCMIIKMTCHLPFHHSEQISSYIVLIELIQFMIITITIKALDVDNYEFVATSKNGFNGSLVEVGFCRHKKIHMIHRIITVSLNCLKIRRENKESEDRSIIIQVAYSDSHSQGSSTYSLLYACIPCAQGFEIIINGVAIAVIAASCSAIILYDIICILHITVI